MATGNLSAFSSSNKTIREYLNDNTIFPNGISNIQINVDGAPTDAHHVDFIWDGNKYYITYYTEENGTKITIRNLEDVLPITFVKKTS